jgi:hypothetical protein
VPVYGRAVRWVLVVLILVAALLAGYTALMLSVSYSDGERAGVLQKFSRKGWVCKTWEGELAMTTVPGVAPILWQFSVRDAQIAERVRQALGRWVVVHYQEHRGVPTSCFGETSYFVDAITVQGAPPGS